MEIAELAGLELDDWQQYALALTLGLSDDRWSSFEVGLIVPRQNGKSEVLIAVALAGLFGSVSPARLQMYTAHEYKTARELFLRIQGLLDPPPDVDPLSVADPLLRDQVRLVRTANGEESIETHSRRRLRFLARTGGSGRGFTGDRVFLDEAHRVTGQHMSALLPTLSARPNPQVLYAAAGPMDDSEQQLAVRERGLVGDESLCYLEWSVPDDADLDDQAAWSAANPAEPDRITVGYIRKERAAMGAEEFARERLCAHGAKRFSVIAPDTWAGLGSATSKITGRTVFGLDVSPDRSHAAIVAAGERPDGLVHVELIDYRSGTGWVVDRCVELARKWRATVVLDPGSAAGSLIVGLAGGGVEPLLVTGREMAQACGHFYDLAVRDPAGLVHHTGHDRSAVLSSAVDAGRRRSVGDAWAWHRKDAASDISPLVAATLAVWGLEKPAVTSGRRPSTVFA